LSKTRNRCKGSKEHNETDARQLCKEHNETDASKATSQLSTDKQSPNRPHRGRDWGTFEQETEQVQKPKNTHTQQRGPPLAVSSCEYEWSPAVTVCGLDFGTGFEQNSDRLPAKKRKRRDKGGSASNRGWIRANSSKSLVNPL
jgi:hypothetical protein